MDLTRLQLMNAAGWIKRDGPSFRNLLRSPVTEVVFGSITCEKRHGNTGTNFIVQDDFSVNSLGLPNDGMEEYAKSLPLLIQATHAAKKKFRLSIAPLGLDDCKSLAVFATEMKVDRLELNLGCPNVHVEGKQKPVFAYDLNQTEQAVSAVCDAWYGPLAVKVSPYYEATMDTFAERMASLLGAYLKKGDSVVICNTLPNYSPKDGDGKPLLQAIAPDGTLIIGGGMAGKSLLCHALSDVQRFRKWTPPHIEITAVGGIDSGKDILNFHQYGATSFQVGTAYFKNDDPRIFSHIISELAATESH